MVGERFWRERERERKREKRDVERKRERMIGKIKGRTRTLS